jgi:serine/threonine protein kinase
LAAQLEPALAGLELIHAGQTKPTPIRLGRLEIKREIGGGGMGIVYEAEQLSLKRRVALKILRYGAVADAASATLPTRSGDCLNLHHTNIVPIFAIGTKTIRPTTMQFIEGISC